MSSSSTHYRAVARAVERGWSQGHSRSADGDGVCAFQALVDAVGKLVIPDEILQEIDTELRRYPSYRLLRRSGERRVEEALWLWNDKFWRRKRTVVRLFHSLADQAQARELEAELNARAEELRIEPGSQEREFQPA